MFDVISHLSNHLSVYIFVYYNYHKNLCICNRTNNLENFILFFYHWNVVNVAI